MIWIAAYVGSVVGALITIIVMTVMRNENRHSVGRLGWLFLTFLSPPIGLVLFLWLGGRRISAEHKRRELIDMPDVDGRGVQPKDEYERFLSRREIQLATEDNELRLVETPVDHYNAYIELFESAEESIYVHTFTFFNDETTDRFLDILCEKARQGLQVRVMADDFGSIKLSDSRFDELREAGGKATMFKPIFRLTRLAYLNFRNHRKIAVVDGRRCILGGSNLARYQITDQPDEETWHDVSVYVEGPVVPRIQAVFCSDWNFATDEELPPIEIEDPHQRTEDDGRRGSRMSVLPVGPDAPQEVLDDFWIYAINQAEKRLWIATPYFVPPPAVMRCLESACRRDLDVRIMVPENSDLKLADYARYDYIDDLREAGAKILLYQPAMQHAKVGLVDDTVAVIGSTNFDIRSFFLNYELSVVLHDDDSVKQISDWFEKQFDRCQTDLAKPSLHRRFFGTVARLFASEL